MANLKESRELVARLARMGVVSAKALEDVSEERVEAIVRNLPPVYESVIVAHDKSGTLHTVRFLDVDPREMNKKTIEWLNGHQLSAIPDGRVMENSTPEIWMRYLENPVEGKALESLQTSFSDWNFKDYDAEKLALGFGGDASAHLNEAEVLLEAEKKDLVARMVNMGVVEPVEIDYLDGAAMSELANSMPELVVNNVIVERDGGLEHLRFMIPGDGAPSQEIETARWQDTFGPFVQSYLMEQGLSELNVVHRSVEYTGGVDWLEYFNQGLDKADPVGDLKALKNGFRNWDLDFRETRLEKGFQNDAGKNLEDAKFYLDRAVLSKLVNAGVLPAFSKEEWKAMTNEQAREAAAKAPLMSGVVDRPGQWLAFFKGKMELAEVKSLFDQNGILFDEKKVQAAFVQKEEKERKEKGMAKKVSLKLATDEQKDIIRKLVKDGKMDKMERDDWEELGFDEARALIRKNDAPASDKQKAFVTKLISEGNLKGFDPVEVPELSKREAAKLIEASGVAGNKENSGGRWEQPASRETRDKISRLVGDKRMEKLPADEWRNLSESKGQAIIRDFFLKEPASDKQIAKIFDMINSGTVSGKALSDVVKKGVVLESDINNLTKIQASAIIGHSPASAAQRDKISELVKGGAMEKLGADEWKNLTIGQANEHIKAALERDAGTTEAGSRERGGADGAFPATDAQKDKIRDLLANGKVKGIGEEDVESMSKQEAGKVISNAPASQAQRDKISELVKDGFVDKVPLEKWKSLASGEASKLIEEGIKAARAEMSQAQQGRNDNSPATDVQIKRLKELHEEGKCDDIPPHLTIKAAGDMIAEAVKNDPLTDRQVKALETMIEKGQVKIDDVSAVNQGRFSEIMDEARKSHGAGEIKPASDAQRKTLSDMVRKGLVAKIPKDDWTSLSSSTASKMIEVGEKAAKTGMGMDR